MNELRSILAFACIGTVFGCALLGCDSKVPGSDIAVRTNDKTSTVSSQKAEEPPKTDLDRSKIPPELQSEAYKYFGLANNTPLDVEITRKPDNEIYTGSTTTRLTKVEKDSATFAADTTGSLHDLLGDDVAVLKPDGVYETASDKMTISTPMLQLPADAKVGRRWRVDSVATIGDQKSHYILDCAIKAVQPLNLAGTTYQALYVVGTGTISGQTGQLAKVNQKQWFVKDVGLVKSEIVQTMKGKSPQSILMVWKPPHKTAKP